jgi:tetratricopeptide (TPR) repeat protein
LNPTSWSVRNAAIWAHVRCSDPKAAIDYFETGPELRPYDSDLGYIFCGLGYAWLLLEDAERALELGRKTLRYVPVMAIGHRLVIAALMQLGQTAAAAMAARHFLATVPTARADRGDRRFFRDQVFVERLIRALQDAGLPG